jgi:hypothetical protein
MERSGNSLLNLSDRWFIYYGAAQDKSNSLNQIHQALCIKTNQTLNFQRKTSSQSVSTVVPAQCFVKYETPCRRDWEADIIDRGFSCRLRSYSFRAMSVNTLLTRSEKKRISAAKEQKQKLKLCKQLRKLIRKQKNKRKNARIYFPRTPLVKNQYS